MHGRLLSEIFFELLDWETRAVYSLAIIISYEANHVALHKMPKHETNK